MNENLGSLLDQLAGQYKKGYRTSEFWVVMLVGLVQVMSASFNPNKTLSSQLSNLTWVGIAYIVSRSGLKVARLASATRIVSTVTSATLTQPQPAASAESATPVDAQAAVNATTSYCWPVAPFDQMHPVRAYLNDPRQGATSSAFHFGIDVSAPDGTPVYAVESGTVYMEGAQNVAVAAPDRSHEFGYWHLVPAVVEHQTVHKHELLGHIAPGWAHVHFAERRGGEYLNPLRSGALTPFADHRPPEIVRIYCARGGNEIAPMRLHGGVDVVVEAFDRPPLPVPPPWADMPVAPAQIRWRIVRGTTAVRDWHTPFDLATRMLPETLYPLVYAPGTRQNHPNAPGVFRFVVAHTWSTGQIPNGEYRIEVEVADLHGNKAFDALPIVIANE